MERENERSPHADNEEFEKELNHEIIHHRLTKTGRTAENYR